MEEFNYVVSFASTRYAIEMESQIKDHALKARLIPTPNVISSGCGLSLRTEAEEIDKVLSLIAQWGPGKCEVYKVIKHEDGTRSAKKIEIK